VKLVKMGENILIPANICCQFFFSMSENFPNSVVAVFALSSAASFCQYFLLLVRFSKDDPFSTGQPLGLGGWPDAIPGQ
jgi:hypothetical protein